MRTSESLQVHSTQTSAAPTLSSVGCFSSTQQQQHLLLRAAGASAGAGPDLLSPLLLGSL